MKQMSALPFSRPYDLASLPPGGAEIKVSIREDERALLAAWLGVESVEALEAIVSLSRQGTHTYQYAARFEARLIQACVVTLVPLPARVEGTAQRVYMVPPRHASRRRPEPVVETVGETDDETDILPDPLIDLAAPVLEELSLVIDPYPRAPGVVFEGLAAGKQQGESPFAALQALKNTPGGRRGRK